jgi:hypothetical protein
MNGPDITPEQARELIRQRREREEKQKAESIYVMALAQTLANIFREQKKNA